VGRKEKSKVEVGEGKSQCEKNLQDFENRKTYPGWSEQRGEMYSLRAMHNSGKRL